MNNDISVSIMKAGHMLQSFTTDPKGNDTNYLLGKVLDEIDDIDINSSDITKPNYSKYRLSLLILHLKILQEFDKYYIPNFKPQKNYVMNLIPPQGAVDGPVLGAVDPADIKYDRIRRIYEKDLIENEGLGKEIALQSELSALKLKLSIYNDKLDVISDSVHFIKNHYTNSASDQSEVGRSINGVFHNSERQKDILKYLHEMEDK
ncbi:hypothetical protein [Edaphovirga cremea]|uniref:hypothetical protein n=1 Tax=Edaphovirga cremea TaxID=2267246 RepID=UPI0039891DD8